MQGGTVGVIYIPDDASEDEVADIAAWQACRAFEERRAVRAEQHFDLGLDISHWWQ